MWVLEEEASKCSDSDFHNDLNNADDADSIDVNGDDLHSVRWPPADSMLVSRHHEEIQKDSRLPERPDQTGALPVQQGKS